MKKYKFHSSCFRLEKILKSSSFRSFKKDFQQVPKSLSFEPLVGNPRFCDFHQAKYQSKWHLEPCNTQKHVSLTYCKAFKTFLKV